MNRRRFLTGAVSGLTLASVGRTLPAWAQAGGPPPPGYVRLRVVQGELTIEGKTGKVYRIEQDDGALGWSGTRGDRFKVAVDNTVADPFSIHWHGIILPNGQDGVPYVTQSPIKPGERRLYDFPLVQAGTYWMHSHFGLQEQSMMTAPLIIREPPAAPEMREVVVMLNDFTTRDPSAILADLRRGSMAGMKMAGGGMKTNDGGMTTNGGGMKMGGSATKTAMKPDLTDVRYDALLANRRPLSDPDLARVTPGETVRLRIINMTSGTNVFLSTGRLAAEAIAVDGEDIVPLPGTRFELGVAQRIDLRVRIPSGQTAYPITAQAEGTDMLAGVVLATAGAAVPALSARAPKPAGALTNRQESRLRSLRPLAGKPVDHHLNVTLGGDMAAYVWSLNGQVWPKYHSARGEAGRARGAHLREPDDDDASHASARPRVPGDGGRGGPPARSQARYGPRVTPADGEGRVRRPLSRLLDDSLPSALSPGSGNDDRAPLPGVHEWELRPSGQRGGVSATVEAGLRRLWRRAREGR